MNAADGHHDLIEACDRYLLGLPATLPGLKLVREGLARRRVPDTRVPKRPPAPPRCGGLEESLAIASQQGASDLARAVSAARHRLAWRSYEAYDPSGIGARFPLAHAFVDLVGPEAGLGAGDFELGLFLIAPRTFYRDHRHKAAELYVPLTGPTRWRFGDKDWLTRQAHEPVWNESMQIHATLVEECFFLCIYAWTSDVNSPAETVPADDWSAIEAVL